MKISKDDNLELKNMPLCVKCKQEIADIWLAYQKYIYRTIKGKDKIIYLCWDYIIVNGNNI